MKRVEIIFDESVENEIMMILRQAQAAHWTRFDNARGCGVSGAKLNNAVGPGVNSLLLVYVEDEQAARIAEALKRFKKVSHDAGGHSGTRCAVMNVEQFF